VVFAAFYTAVFSPVGSGAHSDAKVYKHVYRDFTKDEKDRGRKWWQTLRSAVRLHSRSSHFTAKRGDLWPGAFLLTERTFPSAFLELMTAGKHIFQPLWTLFCVLQRSLLPC